MLASSTMTLELAIARFRDLWVHHGHLPRNRTPDMTRQFQAAQEEMFQLAQLICSLCAPDIQAQLDATRREIIEQINIGIKAPTGARVTTKRVNHAAVVWSEIQITPEIQVDPTITNNAVLFPLLRRLKALLRIQVGLVNTKVHR